MKKLKENLELIQQEKEEDAKVFVGNNTYQRDDLNKVSQILEGHFKKIPNITLEQVASQATELLGTELVNTEKPSRKDASEREPTTNQMEINQEEQYQEIPEVDVRIVRDEKIPLGTMKEI